MGTAALVALVITLQAVAVWCAWRAITSARTSQGAVGWVVVLLAAPYIGVLLYLFLGHHRYRGYLISRRDSERVMVALRHHAARNAPESRPTLDPAAFEKIAELPAVCGCGFRPLIDGKETFDAIFAAIDAAEHYVLVQFYIVHDDDLGRAFRDRLTAAAERGVTVRFMADAVGSHALPDSYYRALTRAGVQVAHPRDGRRPRWRFQINFRNHRKTVVVDGTVGFTGGLNVGDEYMGRDPAFGRWRDTHVEIRGPIVAQLQLIYAEDWHWAKHEVILDVLCWTPPHAGDNMTALLVPTGPADAMETGALFFLSAVVAAQERIWIASPYLVPDTDVLSALKQAALRGVEVRILVPEVIDHQIPWLAAFAYFDELRQAGVEIWRYTDGFMHSKVVLVDDTLAAIGTTNLDNRSFRLNFEAMVVAFDARAAAMVEAFLVKDFARAYRLEKTLPEQRARIRLGAPVARLFAPVL